MNPDDAIPTPKFVDGFPMIPESPILPRKKTKKKKKKRKKITQEPNSNPDLLASQDFDGPS